MNVRLISTLLVVLAGSVVIAFSRLPAEMHTRAVSAPQVGFVAPGFAGNLANGGTLTQQQLTNTPVVLNFWASWCPPCRAEMPALQKMSDRYAPAGVRFISVNSTVQDDPSAALAFLAQNNITFDTVMDQDGSITRAYLVNSLPSTFYIAPNGKVSAVVIGGPISEASLIGNIERMLQEQP